MEEVAEHLPPRKWIDLAAMLGLTAYEIQHIECEFPPSAPLSRYLREVFSVWESNELEPYCWATVVKALMSVDESALASRIEKRIQ